MEERSMPVVNQASDPDREVPLQKVIIAMIRNQENFAKDPVTILQISQSMAVR